MGAFGILLNFITIPSYYYTMLLYIRVTSGGVARNLINGVQVRFAAGSNPVSPSKSKAYQRSTSSQPSSPSGRQPQLSPTRKGSTQSRAAKTGHQAEDLVPEGPRVLSSMLEGIQTDFQSLVSGALHISQ